MNARSDRHVRRKFGCLKISWTIENFWLVTCKKNWEISSPEFSLKAPQETSWQMVLKPTSKEGCSEDYYLSVYLERLNFDSGPDIVRANWKLSLLNCKRKRNDLFTEIEYLFKKTHRYGENIESMNCLLSDFEPFEVDDLHLECQLIVSCDTDSDIFFKCSDAGLRSLSDDLHILFRSGFGSDVVLRIENKDIQASKAILQARNPTLASIIKQNPEIKVIDLLSSYTAQPSSSDSSETCLSSSSFINTDAVERMIDYIYSGRLEEVVSKPSVGLYECALLFDVSEVIAYYIPDELILKSTVDVEENVFFWFITNFESRNEEYILSPPLTEGIMDAIWRLRLIPKGNRDNEEYVSLYAEISGERRALCACLEFALMDADQNFYGFRRLQKSLGHGEILGFCDFIKRDCVENTPFLKDGTLRIIFKLRTSTGVPSLSSESSSITSVVAPPEDHHFMLLSEDISGLFYESEFWDFIIRCGDETFNVHSYIMAARSDAFHEILGENRVSENEIVISDIRSNVIRILLSYIYSGTMKDWDAEVVQEVFSAASYFRVEALINTCSRILVDDYCKSSPSGPLRSVDVTRGDES